MSRNIRNTVEVVFGKSPWCFPFNEDCCEIPTPFDFIKLGSKSSKSCWTLSSVEKNHVWNSKTRGWLFADVLRPELCRSIYILEISSRAFHTFLFDDRRRYRRERDPQRLNSLFIRLIRFFTDVQSLHRQANQSIHWRIISMFILSASFLRSDPAILWMSPAETVRIRVAQRQRDT